MIKLVVAIGLALMVFETVLLVNLPRHESSYAKGFQVRHNARLWRI